MQAERTSPSLTSLTDVATGESVISNAGFGIIEVVVSMFLLGVMAMSFIPLLLNSVKDTAKNTTIATATQIVNEQIEGARAVRSAASTSPSCSDVRQYLNATRAPVVDPRGVTLVTQWSAVACPSVFPGVMKAQVSVKKVSETSSIASATTMIFVASAA